MAKQVWVYVLETNNYSPALTDFSGNKYNGIVKKGTICQTTDDHPSLSNDGTKPLFYLEGHGKIDVIEIEKAQITFDNLPAENKDDKKKPKKKRAKKSEKGE